MVTQDPACASQPAAKSDQTVGVEFIDGGILLCVWWKPTGNAPHTYHVEVAFPASAVTLSYLTSEDVESLLVDLAAVQIPEGQDRDRALRDIDVTVGSVDETGRESLLGGTALQRG